jgi:hypothetical protein
MPESLLRQRMIGTTFQEDKKTCIQIYTDDGQGNGWLVAQFVIDQKV